MVNLADRCILRHEFLLVAMDLGDIAQEDDGTEPLAPVDQGKRAQGNGRRARGNFDAPRGTAHHDDGH